MTDILIERPEAGIAILRLNRPDAMNAFTPAGGGHPGDPYASKHTKQVMWANLGAPSFEAARQLENHSQIVAILTVDFHEATRAFVGKRPPIFTGR
jgi:enoyl-CoA hydratase